MRALKPVMGTFLTTSVLIAWAVAVSPATQAATHDVPLSCGDGGSVTIYGDAGDTFVFTLGEGCTTAWELNNSLVFSVDEEQAQPGLLDFVSSANHEDRCTWSSDGSGNKYCKAWWVQSSGSTTVTASLLAASLGNTKFPEPVILEVGGKVAQVDDNTVANSATWTMILWGGPGDGSSSDRSDSTAAQVPIFTLSSSASDRGTCWPTVSGVGGTWVRLTASGCAPPVGRAQATLLGWATNPSFPVARATDGVAVDEQIAGVRMIFIPVDGYTFLSGDNTLYPIWSN